MCEANVYIRDAAKEDLFMEAVDKMIPRGEELVLESIFGERKTVKATIVEMALVDHRIILERI